MSTGLGSSLRRSFFPVLPQSRVLWKRKQNAILEVWLNELVFRDAINLEKEKKKKKKNYKVKPNQTE